MTKVTCIYFRPATGRNPSDISRNMSKIDAILPQAAVETFDRELHDPTVFVMTLKSPIDRMTANDLTARMEAIRDKDEKPLIEAWSDGEEMRGELPTHQQQEATTGRRPILRLF